MPRMWHVPSMDFSVATLDPNERKQFMEAFEENIELLLELLEAVRCESANIDDTMAAEFMTGISHLVRVFRRGHRLQEHGIVRQMQAGMMREEVSYARVSPESAGVETD